MSRYRVDVSNRVSRIGNGLEGSIAPGIAIRRPLHEWKVEHPVASLLGGGGACVEFMGSRWLWRAQR